MRLFLTGLLVLVTLTVFAQQNRGAGRVVEQTPSTELPRPYANSWAVVIGINEYDKWPPLQYAVSDAYAVRDKLITLGFPEENIILLLNEKATKFEIERILGDELRRKLDGEDRVFIYFAGHGASEKDPDEGYLVPVDGDLKNYYSTCVSMSIVRDVSDRMEAKHIFYAIDACYSGFAVMRSGGPNLGDQSYIKNAVRFPVRQIVTAGRSGEQVVEIAGHGAFTKVLLMALDGQADKYSPKGILTGSEVCVFLENNVALETNYRQTPRFGRLASGEGEFLFMLPDVEPKVLSDLLLSDPKGTVEVRVNARNSEVYINGTRRGLINPGESLGWEVDAGKVEIRIDADGRQITKEIFVNPDEWKDITIELPSVEEPSIGLPDTPEDFREETVHVGSYSIHKYEVSNAQFVKFLNDRNNDREGGVDWMKIDQYAGIEQVGNRFSVKLGYDDQPVVQVSWYAAQAYCEWVDKRLPTEEEWQHACEGDRRWIYPWGKKFEADRANIEDMPYPQTAAVGTFPLGASPYGAMDMAGNVWEWTGTLGEDNTRVVRGGSFIESSDDVKCSSRLRLAPIDRGANVGFRCVK